MPHESRRQTRALRIGLIFDGVVVDERVVESPRPVTIGTEPGATLSIDADEVPKQMQLLDWESGEYVLRAGSGVTGKIRSDEGIRSLDEARLFAETDGEGAAVVSLAEVAAGRIQVGEAVVLFQRVTPAREPTRPTLPGELKRGVLSGVDGRLAGALAVTALLQIGFVVWTQLTAWPEPIERELEPIPREFVAERREPPSIETKEPETTSKTDETKKAKRASAEESTASESETSADEETPNTTEPERPEEAGVADVVGDRNLAESAREGTVLEALGSEGGEDLLSQMETASPTGAFEEAVARNGGDGGGGSEGMFETGGRGDSDAEGRTFEGGPLGATPGAREAERGVETGEGRGVQIRCPNCTEPEGEEPEEGGPPRGIGGTLRRHMGRIRHCYERALKRNPDLAGKIVIAFRVTANGEARPVVAARDTVGGGVAECVRGVILQIDFPATGSRSPRIEKSFVFEPSQ